MNKTIEGARAALNQALLAGKNTTELRASLKKLQATEDAKPRAHPADEVRAAQRAREEHDALISADAAGLAEASRSRIDRLLTSFAIPKFH